jgi:hypothetical protein
LSKVNEVWGVEARYDHAKNQNDIVFGTELNFLHIYPVSITKKPKMRVDSYLKSMVTIAQGEVIVS